MRILAALLLAFHGTVHFAGVKGALWPSAIQSQRLLILPRFLEAACWMFIGLLFVGVAVLLATENDGWRALLLWASGGSLLMCLTAWPTTRFGVVIDALLVVLTLLLAPKRTDSHLNASFDRELSTAKIAMPELPRQVVEESALSALPPSVQRYLRFMGVVGHPRDSSLRASFSARFRRDRGDWLACEAIQYDARAPVARVYMMQLSLWHFLPVTVRDEYLNGRGVLEARAFDLFSIARGSGHELDLGELVTYLNDALLMAPSLLLGPETTWSEVDANTFNVTLVDGQTTVKGRIQLDARGAPIVFSTTDRFFDTPDGKRVRTEWRTPVEGWQSAGGRSLPTRAQAVWQLPSGPLPYADFTFDPTRITFNTAAL